jgi:hypothetical protein
MGYGRAPGYPDYSAAGLSAFIPEKWSTKLVEKFYDATVLTHISNTNYEGEIKGLGDKVWIRTRGTVPVYLNVYQKGGVLPPPDRIESPRLQLLIDQNTHFYFGVDDIDKYQSDIALMSQWAEDATENEKVAIDTDVLAYVLGWGGYNPLIQYATSQVDALNQGATAGRIFGLYNLGTPGAPAQVTTANIIKYLAMAEAVLGEYNIPDDTSKFFIMPRVMAMLLKTSDIKDASMMGDATSALRSGRLGRLLNWTLYASNLLPHRLDPTTGQLSFYCLFGHPLGLTFADQFTETNYINNPETTFGKFIKSLHVFGREVIKPSALGCLYAAPTIT